MTTPRLLAGASGYSFKEWKGNFYPEKIKAEDMLAYYAERLPTVEINNTFYRMPKTAVLETWAGLTPEHFRFAIKASRRITHISRIKAESAAEPLGYLYRNLAALGGKRGPVLFQLPPNLKADVKLLEEFLPALPRAVQAAFEFRNPSWFTDEVFNLLKANNRALCIAETEERTTPDVVTADFAYYRYRKPSYTPEERRVMVDRIREHLGQDRNVFAYFKHEETPEGALYAVQILKEIL